MARTEDVRAHRDGDVVGRHLVRWLMLNHLAEKFDVELERVELERFHRFDDGLDLV